MKSINDCITEYKKQIQKGDIKVAYRKIMEFMMDLRIYFKNKYSGSFVSGSLYLGYMDMTYFSLIPESLKKRKLKIAIVFNHESLSFEVWLAAANKGIQNEYWKSFNESTWRKYRLPSSTKGNDSILYQVAFNDKICSSVILNEVKNLNLCGSNDL